MTRYRLAATIAIVCLVGPLSVGAQPAPSPEPAASSAPAAAASTPPAPGPPPTAAITSSAKDWLHRLQTGAVDRTQFAAKMNAALTDEQVKQVASQFSVLGDVATFVFSDSRISQGITVYRYDVTFKPNAQTWTWVYAIDGDGKIAGLFLQQKQRAF